MGDEKAKGATPKAQPPEIPPWLPLPADFKDFLACKRDSLALGGDELQTGVKGVTAKFTPDPDKKRHFKVTIKGIKAAGGGDLPDPLELDASVDKDGNIRIHTKDQKDLPQGVKDGLKKFVQDFNKYLKGNGKKLGDPETKDGKLVLSKVAATAMHILPTWEKAAAGALMAIVTVGGIVGMDIGDTTETRTISEPVAVDAGDAPAGDGAIVANGGYCVHHDDTSRIELQLIVPSALNGVRIDATYDTGPNGGAATGEGVAEDGYVSIPVDVTGRGPGTYSGLVVRDLKHGLPLRFEYAPPDPAYVTPTETLCPGRETLAGERPWIGAVQLGADHAPGSKYTDVVGGSVIGTPSVRTDCLSIGGVLPGSLVVLGGDVTGTGRVDDDGRVLVAGGITQYGDYTVERAEVVDPNDPSIRSTLDLPALLREPYPINGGESACDVGALPPGFLRVGTELGDERAPRRDTTGVVRELVTENIDALPWALLVAAGVNVAILGALFLDKARRTYWDDDDDGDLEDGPRPRISLRALLDPRTDRIE